MEIIWNRHYEQIHRFVRNRVHNIHDAEDIVQTTYLKIVSHLPQLLSEEKLNAWIFRIARNTIIDYFRGKKHYYDIPEDYPAPTRDDANHNLEIASCIGCFIRQLPHKYREAIELTELKGMTQIQLSELLGITVSGAKSRVQRGRAKLKELLLSCCRFELDRYGNVLDYVPIQEPGSCCNSACAS